jgi:hypothetical protein
MIMREYGVLEKEYCHGGSGKRNERKLISVHAT